MSFDPVWLFLSLIPSGIGFVLFIYGKKQGRFPQLSAGLALMVYPYFIANTAVVYAIGVGGTVALFFLRD